MSHQFKARKCYSCEKFVNGLIQMPFDKYICAECIRLKCDVADQETLSQIEEKPIRFYLDQIGYHYDGQMSNRYEAPESQEAKLCRLKNKLNEFRSDVGNFAARLKRIIDIARYEVELGYETAKAKAERRLFEKLNWIDLQAEESAKSYAANVEKVVNSVDVLMNQSKTVEFKSETQMKEYETMLRRELFKFELHLGENKIFEAKRFIPKKTSIGTLKKSISQILETSTRISTKSALFSVDSLLSNHHFSAQGHLKLNSLLTLAQPHSDQNMYMFFFKCDQTRACSLELYTCRGEPINRIDIVEQSTEIFHVAPVNKSYLVLCSRDVQPAGSYVKFSLYNSRFDLLLVRSHPILVLDRFRPLDLVCDWSRNKIYFLLFDAHFGCFTLFLFNLNLDLLNSFNLCECSTISGAKIFACDDLIYMKHKTSPRSSTQISIFDSIYGRLLKTCQLDYDFDFFYVTKLIDDLAAERLIFLSKGRYYVYDLCNDVMLHECSIYESQNKFINFFSLNATDRTISSILSLN